MTEAAHKLGEVLRAAREAKGVDLPRVERETKIRERYLSALERGEYRELPGAVYTKGFLRNYGAYLGLDPEYLIDLYRLETAASPGARTTAVAAPPRPLAVKRSRAFVITPGAIASVILTIGVIAFIAYLGFELVNFARQPELRITAPAGNVSGHTELSITVQGETEPNAVVIFSELRENPTVTADATGAFEVTISLVPGSNVMRVVARDPETGRDSEVEERTIEVTTDVAASPSPNVAALVIAEPADGGSVSGPLTVAGTTSPSAAVVVTAVSTGAPAPSFRVADAAGIAVAFEVGPPAAPEPTTFTADAAGAFSGSLTLAPGAWDVTVEAADGETLTRSVTVGPPGDTLGAEVRIEGGASWMELAEDGSDVEGYAGGLATDGTVIQLSGEEEIRIRAGNAGAVRVIVNGIDIGVMGTDGAVVEWLVTRGDA